ncbi:hypothetical protein [Clostridium fungisolvens]|uniref:Uncharacterized protein n=1 Tax=Clostridium fungisolvens TaxID=1604897 RepID=A0A6V8SC96_9CLOT|nr:hypothetical protein [Clostridium fungisolvens]GFP74192.1 hypothetical protein bsdtw1_00237 [Clostridium fungisolvens]
MKSIKKTLSLLLICLFVFAMVPANVFGDIAKAETSDSKFLKYNEGFVSSEKIYKDKALMQISYRGYNKGVYYFNNGKVLGVGKFVHSDFSENKEIINEYNNENPGVGAVFDLEQGEVTGSYDLNVLDNTLKNKYGKENLDVGRLSIADDKNGIWYIYNIYEGHNIKSRGILTPSKKIVEVDAGDSWVTYTGSSDKFYGIIKGPSVDSDLTDTYLRTIESNGTTKDIKIDERISRNYNIRNIMVANNKFYIQLESPSNFIYGEKIMDGYYELIEDQNVLCKGDMLVECTDVQFKLTKDSNGCIWYVKDGALYKFDNNKWIMKYEVDKRMNRVVAYDDNNFVLSYSLEGNKIIGDNNTTTYTMNGGYTLVQNGKNITIDYEGPSTQDITGSDKSNNGSTGSDLNNASNINATNGQSTSIQTNGVPNIITEKAVVGLVKDGVLPIQVNKLNRNEVNLVEASSTTNANKLEVTIADTKAIREGTGSLQIKMGQSSVINLPFSAIDKSLLTDKAKVILSTSAESNTDLVKGLKAVKKLYSIDVEVVDGEKKTAVHKLANGESEINFTLSDEELTDLNKSNLAIFYYNEDTKKFEYIETKVDGNKVTFKTPHFSKFIIAEKSKKSKEIIPKTETRFDAKTIAIIASILVVLGIGALGFRKFVKLNK